MTLSKYSYRRQYILSPRTLSGLEGWKNYKIDNNKYLYVHPDLDSNEMSIGTISLYVLGYMLDPYNPEKNTKQIIETIITKIAAINDIFEHITKLCGRYVIILKLANKYRIFSDPGGLRQVFYCKENDETFWLSSNLALLTSCNGHKPDQAIVKDIGKSKLFIASPDYCWYPGSLTPYRNIHHLVPNHYIDLETPFQKRYWPDKKLSEISVDECVEKACILLDGIFNSAVHNFKNIASAISCGLDSRLLLAAGTPYSSAIRYFTHAVSGDDSNNPDIEIPASLLPKLGIAHNVIVYPEKIEEEFEQEFIRNNVVVRKKTMLNAFAIADSLRERSKDLVVVYGNVSEITKRDRYRWPDVSNCLINGSMLTEMAGMTHSTYALDTISTWYTSSKWVSKYNVNILDLMHWEHRVGSWAAMALHEYDIAYETLCPFGCREYIETLLRVPFKFRTMPDYKVHRKMINKLNREVLQYPIITVNRHNNPLLKRGVDLLYTTKLYDYLKYFYLMLKKLA